MSNLGCTCGAVTRDNTDAVPCKGHLISDSLYYELVEAVRKEVQEFFGGGGLEAKDQAGKILAEDQLHYAITRGLLRYTRDAYQCTACGRLWVQRKDDANRFDSFAPEQAPHNAVF